MEGNTFRPIFSVVSQLIDCSTTLPTEVFTQRNFVADFIQLKLNFIQKSEKSVFDLPFGGLRGNVRTPPIARWKARARFPIRHNWTFSLSLMACSQRRHDKTREFCLVRVGGVNKPLRLRRYKRKSVEVSVFRKGLDHFRRIFRVEDNNFQQPPLGRKTTVIRVSYSVETLTDSYFLLSQYAHLTDGRTDWIATAIPCVALHAYHVKVIWLP